MVLPAFDPPGKLDEISPQARAQWSQFISDRFDRSIAGTPEITRNDSPRPQYYNAVKTETASDAQTKVIRWTAFPRRIEIDSISDQQRWQRADESRFDQDEYCEWSVTRDNAGKITRVAFTCEGPEYWRLLAAVDPDKVVALYQEFVSPDVRREQLFSPQGQYNARNFWNNSTTQGAMHLVQDANTLNAAIEIGAASTIVRVIGGTTLAGEQELIRCGQYGDPDRNSDPHIGGEVNALARAKADITLNNPVGIYFDRLSTADWATPDGADPGQFWRYVRGAPECPVRAVYEVPPDRGYTVGDITIAGQPIGFGAQIADFIDMKLTGVACRFGQSTAAPQIGCTELIPGALGFAEAAAASEYERSHR